MSSGGTGESPRGGTDDAVGGPSDDAVGGPAGDATESNRFGWRGWTLVGAIVVAFFVVPVAVLYLPAAQELIRSIGFTMRDGYLVLPLLPAFGLGALAVWSALRSRSA